ncbi:MAG: ABC transporter permease [Pelagibacterium sp. SCN 64-44]|nr:MAG: ABC transporter permease [Pelagibacterium sp. SCN 64-44]
MTSYIIKRILMMIPTVILISFVSFGIILLPPGDFLTSYVAQLASTGSTVDQGTIAALRELYGVGEPFYVQYWKWISRIIFHGDFGLSFEWNQPVSNFLWGRVGLTFFISGLALMVTWLIAFPIGILSAVRQYSALDYGATLFAFMGLAVPDYLLALVLMIGAFVFFGADVAGLFSLQYADAPWSWGKVWDMLGHVWVPILVLSTERTAVLVRVMRANLLDELQKPYVTAARAKGISEAQVLIKYPVRAALNPFVSTVGWELPNLISGVTIVSVVLSLPTTGPILLQSLLSQDMYLAAAFVLVLSVLTLVGTLISDILLAMLDPRIRLQGKH